MKAKNELNIARGSVVTIATIWPKEKDSVRSEHVAWHPGPPLLARWTNWGLVSSSVKWVEDHFPTLPKCRIFFRLRANFYGLSPAFCKKWRNRMDWNEMAQSKVEWSRMGWDGTEQKILTGLSHCFSFFNIYVYLVIYLAVPGLSCGYWIFDLHCSM